MCNCFLLHLVSQIHILLPLTLFNDCSASLADLNSYYIGRRLELD